MPSAVPPDIADNETLTKNLEWYIANQSLLATKYDGKILLIVDQNLIGAFDAMGDAYTSALKNYRPGAFTLQPCSSGPDSYTLVLHNPIFNVIGT